VQLISIDARHSGFIAAGPSQDLFEEIRNESWVVASKIFNIQRCVQGPEIISYVKDFAESSISPGHNARGFDFGFIVGSSNS